MAQLMKKLMSSTRYVPLALAGGLALTTFGAMSARADSTDELLELLRRKGAINKREYAVIKSRHDAEKVASRGAGGAYIRGEGGAAPRYVTALDKGLGIRLPGPTIFTKEGATSTGDVDISISGNLNAFYVQQFGKSRSPTVAGGLTESKNSAAVRSGLLPSAVILDVATKQEGLDISGTLGFYTGINNVNVGALGLNASGGGFAKSIGTPSIAVKLAYLKVGTNGYGTFEAGRDFGLFGQDILTFDQNELAVGLPGSNLAPGNNALGNLGLGYIVSDFIPQFRYTTPDYKGFTATFAVETPYDASTFGAISGTSGGGTIAGPGGLLSTSSGGFAHDAPQLAGRLKYVGNLMPNAMLTAWLGGMTQNLEGIRSAGNFLGGAVAVPAVLRGGRTNFQAYAGEAGAKVDVGAAEVIGYGYYGKGVGTTALFFDGLDERGEGRQSYGFLAQASYTFFSRLTIAGGYGISYLEPTAFDRSLTRVGGLPERFRTNTNVKTNGAAVATVRYKVTKWLNLIGQYAHGTSKNDRAQKDNSDAVIGGAQVFF